MKRPSAPSPSSTFTLNCILIIVMVTSPRAVPGDLDLAFGDDGVLTTDFFGSFDEAHAVTIDRFGRIVAAGFAGTPTGAYLTVGRCDSDGVLDPSFGAGGVAFVDLGVHGQANAVAIDSLDRIVIAGVQFTSSIQQWAVAARFNGDGSMDRAFGVDGVARVFAYRSAIAHGVVLDTAGRIVVVGTLNGGIGIPSSMALARLNADGSPDNSFDLDGMAVPNFDSWSSVGHGVALDPADRIVVAGRHADPDSGASGFAIARYNEDGSLDESFGDNGLVTTDVGGSGATAHAILVDSDGRVVVAGGVDVGAPNGPDFALVRFDTHGTLDPSFGSGGMAISDFGGDDEAYDLTVDASDRLIVAGESTIPVPELTSNVRRFALARYLPDGSPDPLFGHDGMVTTSFGWFGGRARGVAVDALGRIVAAGAARPASVYDDWALARYVSEGSTPSPSPPLDIRPGDPDNVLSLAARGKLAVAVVSTAAFDARAETDSGSLTFGRTGDEASLLHRKDGSPSCNAADVNGDGRVDLVCEFLVKLAGFQLSDHEGVLHGSTMHGGAIVSSEPVYIVP